MTTNITEDHHRAFEALTTGKAGNFLAQLRNTLRLIGAALLQTQLGIASRF